MEYLARLRAAPERAQDDRPAAEVCAVVVAHNECDRVAERLRNLLASDYQPEKLRVVLVSDGSTDRTVEEAGSVNDPRVEILALPERSGKADGINAGVQRASAELIVFSDTRQSFAADTITRLAAHFADPSVGAVSGSLEIAASRSGIATGVDTYWRMEKSLRAAESRWDSCIGCTGAVYAIRREAFAPLPSDTILDDVVIPMEIAARGWRVIHDPEAVANRPTAARTCGGASSKTPHAGGQFSNAFPLPSMAPPGTSPPLVATHLPQIPAPLRAASPRRRLFCKCRAAPGTVVSPPLSWPVRILCLRAHRPRLAELARSLLHTPSQLCVPESLDPAWTRPFSRQSRCSPMEQVS